LLTFSLAQVPADIFGLDVADREGFMTDLLADDDILGAAGDVARLVGGEDLRVEGFEEGFKSGAVGVLGSVALGEVGLEVVEVVGDGWHDSFYSVIKKNRPLEPVGYFLEILIIAKFYLADEIARKRLITSIARLDEWQNRQRMVQTNKRISIYLQSVSQRTCPTHSSA
jgi:hypothetical protein